MKYIMILCLFVAILQKRTVCQREWSDIDISRWWMDDIQRCTVGQSYAWYWCRCRRVDVLHRASLLRWNSSDEVNILHRLIACLFILTALECTLHSNLTVENMRYLSVDQALADIAHFITTIRKQAKYHRSKVVVVGGSYAGAMATWFRQKYPHLAVGAWSSSAPLKGKLDFSEFKEIVGQSIALVGGSDCFHIIQQGIAMAEELLRTNQLNRFKELFNICDEFDTSDPYNVGTFFSWLSNIAASSVQQHRTTEIQSYCKHITANYQGVNRTSSQDLLKHFANAMRLYLDHPYESCTRVNFVDSIRRWKGVAYMGGEFRQWIYQTCSEFGWYQTSTSTDQPFGSSFPVDLNVRTCRELYGDRWVRQMPTHNLFSCHFFNRFCLLCDPVLWRPP